MSHIGKKEAMQSISETPVEYVAEVTGPYLMTGGGEPYHMVVARVGEWGQGPGAIYLTTEPTIDANIRAIERMISTDEARACKPHHIEYRMGKPSRFAKKELPR